MAWALCPCHFGSIQCMKITVTKSKSRSDMKMHAFTKSLLARGSVIEIECWNQIAHEACKLARPFAVETVDPTNPSLQDYWFWSDIFWDTREVARYVNDPSAAAEPAEPAEPVYVDTSNDLDVDQLVGTLEHIGLRVITFE